MDIVEFVEKICGIQLFEYQKEMLRKFSKFPEDSVIVMGRHGPIILDKDSNRITTVN